jgi:NAD(P)-dependent dehydrogenase (short-subunit alcohol dehydrogenase family)
MPVALITGAGSGIGQATVTRFADAGWNVVATMRTPTGQSSDTRLITPLDVTDPVSVRAAVDATLERFGQVDVVVNNAGYGQYGIFETLTPEQVQAQFNVNLFGVQHMMRAVLPHLRAQGHGVIVNVSSGAGLYGLPMSSVYCASKFALEGFSEAVSYELGALGITVKLVIPHGGVSGTGFPGHGDPGANPVPEYDPVVAALSGAMAALVPPVMTPAETVAATVFESATDSTDRLRYLVGIDARGFLGARDTMGHDDYLAFMRRQFATT